MENASKALEIAAGVLLGVMIMALIVYFFKSVGEWPQQKDDEATVEQTAKFNLEYEVYDKKAMYGVDIISCLNKAKDNNDRYFNEDKLGFLASGKNPEEFLINVFVQLIPENNKYYLNESVDLYYIDANNNKRQLYNTDSIQSVTVKMQQVFGSQIDFTKLNVDGRKATTYTTDTTLGQAVKGVPPATGKIDLGEPNSNKYFSLLKVDSNEKPVNGGTVLEALLPFSGVNMRVSANNTNSTSLNVWSSAVWTTALYDLKSKKFQCVDIKYSEKTGRVNSIYFNEIKK